MSDRSPNSIGRIELYDRVSVEIRPDTLDLYEDIVQMVAKEIESYRAREAAGEAAGEDGA